MEITLGWIPRRMQARTAPAAVLRKRPAMGRRDVGMGRDAARDGPPRRVPDIAGLCAEFCAVYFGMIGRRMWEG